MPPTTSAARQRAGSTASTNTNLPPTTSASSRPLSTKTSTQALAPAKTNQHDPQQQQQPEKKSKKEAVEKPINLPDPPQVIVDHSGVEWVRGKLLGSGGFARVYDATNSKGHMKAFKVVAKKHLQSRKARSKILAEIMIHSSLDHPNIVRMEDTFEDDEHVYFKLELCRAGSMNDMVKRRGRYHDSEARFFMVQILAGCQGMHTRNIIHRDLKLGNIFLDEGMNVKIGDFGLAALLKEVGERKKTVCGTPNYIAPEILYDEGDGHSFEVDVWSVGVILYTMLVGKPPFQTSDIERIYEKIRDNDYRIPPEAGVRPEAQDLIIRILAPRPSDRPSLIQIMEHPWFTCGAIPTFIPLQATHQVPMLTLPHTWEDNERNFEYVKQKSHWDPYADDLVDDDEYDVDPREELRQQEALEQEREKMDKQFHKAIQPASPIATLLKAGRQPLVKTTVAAAASKPSEGSLARQLQALSIGRGQSQQNIAASAQSQGKQQQQQYKDLPDRVAPPPPSQAVDKENARPAPKAPTASRATAMGPPSSMPWRRGAAGAGAAATGSSAATAAGSGAGHLNVPQNERDAEERRMLGQKARLVAGMGGNGQAASSAAPTGRPATATSASSDEEGAFTPLPPSSKANTVDLMIHYLYEATKASRAGISYAPLNEAGGKVRLSTTSSATAPSSFIICWVDHSDKYGMGYAMNDGSIGVHFRDETSMALNWRRDYFDYIPITRRSARLAKGGEPEVKRENFCLDGYTDSLDLRSNGTITAEELPFDVELYPKVKVMRFFEQDLMERLYGCDSPLTYQDEERTTEMTFVMKWWRCSSAMFFRLSNGTFQFNFYDHIKVFVSECGMVISFIPPVDMTGGVPQLRSYYITELVAIAHHERSAREAEAIAKAKKAGVECSMRLTTPMERRVVRGIVAKKLDACRMMLEMTTRSSSTNGSSGGSNGVSSTKMSRTGSTTSVNSTASTRTGTASTRR